MTSIPVSFHTSGSDLVTSHKLSKVSPGQAKRLNRKLLRKNLGTVESRAGGWVGDIILLELVQKTCSSKKPLCIRCGSAPAAKGSASQVSQTQRLQQLKLLTAFLPVSPQSRGANPTGCPSSTLGDYKCPQSSPLQFPYQRSRFACCFGKLAQAALLADSTSKLPKLRRRQTEHMCWERKLCCFGRVLTHERETMKSQEMLT